MVVYPQENSNMKAIFDTVFLYQSTDDVLTVLYCDGERRFQVLIENDDVKLPLQIVITPSLSVITSVGICFSSIDTFKNDFWAIDWLSLAQYNTSLEQFNIDQSYMINKNYIFVTFEKEGIHCYPEAGTKPELQDVSFLQYPHRHMFKFIVMIQVTHNNRDIEFIQFKRWCESLYNQGTLQLDSKSCEMLAQELQACIAQKYPNLDMMIQVSEDGENGAISVWANEPNETVTKGVTSFSEMF